MSILTEVVGQFLFTFTRSRALQSRGNWTFGYNPLESTGREWYYQPELIYQNTVTGKLPHGIISGRAILILKLLMRAHQMKKHVNIKMMTGQWLGNGWSHPLSVQLANQFVIFARKEQPVRYKVLRYRGPEQINVNCVPRKVAARREIKAPMYIDLPTVLRAGGLRRFQAIALSSSWCSSR